MAKHQDIVGHYASLYNRIGLWIIAGLTLLGFLAEQIAFKYGFTYSIVFFLRGDKTCLLSFALIFATYYVLMLVFDCIFFSHIEKKHLIK